MSEHTDLTPELASGLTLANGVTLPNRLAKRRHDVVSASAVALTVGGPMFRAPRALREAEILDVVRRFGTAARVAATAGFGGVELHAAHTC